MLIQKKRIPSQLLDPSASPPWLGPKIIREDSDQELEEEDLFLDVSKFVFTTEAHLLPLSLARLSNRLLRAAELSKIES